MFGLDPLWDAAARGVILGAAALFWVITLVRTIGARTLSKMTAFDFIVTLATASLVATAGAAETLPNFIQAVAAFTTLLACQYGLALARRYSQAFRRLIENEPLLLFHDGRFLDAAMRQARVRRGDIHAKLRQNGVTDPSSVSAIILETTGDISILGEDGAPVLMDDVLLTPSRQW